MLGLSASLLAGEMTPKDTTPLGPEVAADPSTFKYTLAPHHPHWKSASPAIPKLLLFFCKQKNQTMQVVTIWLVFLFVYDKEEKGKN